MRSRAMHAALVLIAVLPWLFGILSMWLALRLALAAHRVWPDADRGNCWSYVAPRWHRRGGYILVRMVDGARFVPHAIWLARMPDGAVVRHTQPLMEHAVRPLTAWRELYFRYRVARSEDPHDARWADTLIPSGFDAA